MDYILLSDATNNLTILFSIVGGLITGVVTVWRLYLGALRALQTETEKRISDKDSIIDDLKKEVEKVRAEREKLILEIQPALEAANRISENVYELLKNER